MEKKINIKKGNNKEFNATSDEYWKKNHKYSDDKASKASEWMEKHYGNLEEDEDLDLDDDYIDNDDWRQFEPSENDVKSILSTIESKCNECGLTFRDLGDNEFGIILRGTGKIDFHKAEELMQMIHDMAQNGIIYNTGGGLTLNGPSHVKYRIINGLNENRKMSKKQTIRLNESQFNNLVKQIVKESVKRIISEEQQRLYHWDISTMNDEMEALSHVKSSDALFGEYEGFNGFKTPNAAFNSGLKELKKYNDGSYIMEVWCYVGQANGKPPTTEYVDGYLATNVNGMIRKF